VRWGKSLFWGNNAMIPTTGWISILLSLTKKRKEGYA
jgi:hypothetical protein